MKGYVKSYIALIVLAAAALGVIALWPRPARAAGPWYVAPGGNDSNSCSTTAAPCATINGAIGKASSGDTVYVATGTYTSTTGSEVVLIDRDITLSGGWDLSGTLILQNGMSTIDGEGVRRGIAVNSGVTAQIERFVVQNGSSNQGGGIGNEGIMILINSAVSSNTTITSSGDSGSGIYNTGTMTLTSVTVSSNTFLSGGAIQNWGTMTVTNSVISNNSPQGGGGGGIQNYGSITLNGSNVVNNLINGIWNFGIVTLNNSTISDNTGYGIENVGGTLTLNNSTINNNYGGISIGSGNASNVSLNNSTISGNSGDSGIRNWVSFGGNVTLNNTTITDNTPYGINNSSGGTVTSRNSILAGNKGDGSSNVSDCLGSINSSGYNLVGNSGGCGLIGGTDDLINIEPGLFLALIGSPGYHPLLPGSPAINAGDPAGCEDNLGNPLTTDQRGITRVGRCDIGAYEYDPNNDPLTYTFLPLIMK